MAKAGLDVGELLLKIVTGETGEISKVDYAPQKPDFIENSAITDMEMPLKRSLPEEEGVSSAFLTSLIKNLAKNRECRMHKIMVLRHGNVIAESSFAPYKLDMWHVSYSMCKSIVAMAIGILVSEGKLSVEDKLSDIFSAKISRFAFLKKTIKVKDLLTMSSGADFNEAGAISGNDWRKSFLEAGSRFEPGTQFDYNSMNTYMLSAIVTEITGDSLFRFCKERIFNPMGIRRIFWESCPQNITKGGWGLFIRTEDMAKLGQLYLQNGKWNGEQLVPEEWVKESVSHQIETGKDDNEHYGYQLWINDDRPGSYAFNGMLGQNVFVYPDIDMIVVTNAGNSDIFQTSPMAVTIREAMKNLEVSNIALPKDFKAQSELNALCRSLSGQTSSFPVITSGGWKKRAVTMTSGRPKRKVAEFESKRSSFKASVASYNVRNENMLISTWLHKLNGHVYELENKNLGLFPIMMQVVHNNFTDGISKIGFRLFDSNFFFIDIYEGTQIYSLRCGFGGKSYVNTINMHGENYKLSMSSVCTTDEYNRLVIRNEISFLEEACMRTFNIYFDDNASDREDKKGTFIHPSVPSGIELRLNETPGTDILIDTMTSIAPEGLGGMQGRIFNKIVKGGVKDFLEGAMKNTIQPSVRGHLIS
ncbi:class C beta-lactamase-related serine hydrolase [Butyrivibrio sp. X503]|uniref:serine hydrolase domain-containing protein n=1 Tax=Butyrivibrio sp. X503 TaxID=2364878 RepID=UPI000EA8650C|nr:serine hydrolase [Butyrivibrio sp. X503]RKM57119.1 class C beta-lactamase-related serine hydrolase [Butyrivibrio sp. X503]